MKFDAVIFDMDGLLLDTEKVCLDAFVATNRAHGLPDGTEVFLNCVGTSASETNRIVTEALQGRLALEVFNGEWDASLRAMLHQNVPVKPGAACLLRSLDAKGLPMAVATSTRTDKAVRHLTSAGLISHFKGVIGSDQVTRHKPDPEVYHTAAALLGLPAARCVAFEDSTAGTTAALASGATTVQVPDMVPPPDALRARGHVIAPDLLSGAVRVGLLSPDEILEAEESP